MKKFSFIIAILITGLLGVSSCKKEKEPEPAPAPTPAPTPATSINSSYRSTYTMDGTDVSLVYGSSNFSMSYGAGGDIGSGGSASHRYYDATIADQNDKGITITKGTMDIPAGGYGTEAQFAAFFPAGTYSYSPAGAMNPDGIVVSYWDGTTNWRSDNGTGNQSGSVFTMVASQVVTGTSDYTVKFYATYNCKVYDDGGNVKTITNGVFIGDFAKL
jgi:hypothetical protein